MRVDKFIADRKKERATKKKLASDKLVSPATINRELRYLRSALRLAEDWGYISKVSKFRFLKTQEKIPTYAPPEHFTAIIRACSVATLPNAVPNVDPPDWWRGLLVLLYMTGWRIGKALALRWEDVDLENATAISRAESNKGRREQRIPLHPLVVQYLRPLSGSFSETVFPWDHNKRTLWVEFGSIQKTAKIAEDKPMPKGGKNGRWYGFHDLRRSFAIMNAESLDLYELRDLMQHRSLSTTQGYVNMAKRLNRPVSNLFVPDLPKGEVG